MFSFPCQNKFIENFKKWNYYVEFTNIIKPASKLSREAMQMLNSSQQVDQIPVRQSAFLCAV